MNVAMEHPEEILFSWDSGFGNSQLGTTEDVLGTDGTISKGQQIRYTPQKVNRPDGVEIMGRRAAVPTRTCRTSSIASGPERRPTARSTWASVFPLPAVWPWIAIGRAAPCSWDAAREEIV